MAYQTIDNLPQEVRDQLPRDAQQIFVAAFNSAESDGLSSERSQQVAWDTIKNNYEQKENGKWERLPSPKTDASPLGQMKPS